MGMARLDELIADAFEMLSNMRPQGNIIELHEFTAYGHIVWATSLSEACKCAQVVMIEGPK